MNIQSKLSGNKWEGAFCLACFVLAALALYYERQSPLFIIPALVLGVFSACFGLSYLRTWKRIYRNAVLGILLIVAIAFYLALLLPRG